MSSKVTSGTTKRRRKRQSLCYKTGNEKRRGKGVLPSTGVVHKDHDQHSLPSARAENNGDDSVLKHVENEKKRQPSLKTKSMKKSSATRSEKIKSTAETSSEAGHRHSHINDLEKTNKGSIRSVLTPTNGSQDHISKTSASTKNQKKARVVSQTKEKNSLPKSVKRFHEPHSEIINEFESHASSPKKAKTTSQKSGNKVSQNSVKQKDFKANTKQRKNPVIPDRIKDVCVTKREFAKWKPLTKSTKKFTEEILKSVIIDVMATLSDQNKSKVVGVLDTLRNRILERLPDWKAPLTQGDYRKMESQNEMSEEIFLEKSREINALDRSIEEEQRVLEIESAKVEELKRKIELLNNELHSLDNEKAHPLIERTKNTLVLSPLSQEMFDKIEDVPLGECSEEESLSQTLLQLQKNVTSIGLTKWMTKLANLTQRLGQD